MKYEVFSNYGNHFNVKFENNRQVKYKIVEQKNEKWKVDILKNNDDKLGYAHLYEYSIYPKDDGITHLGLSNINLSSDIISLDNLNIVTNAFGGM